MRIRLLGSSPWDGVSTGCRRVVRLTWILAMGISLSAQDSPSKPSNGAAESAASESSPAIPSADSTEALLPRIPPTAPEVAGQTLQIDPAYRVDLMAAEPQIADPVAIAFDARGRLYVVEMRDYSERRPERLGRVRLLEDTQGDGVFDRSTVFLDNLPWPTAVTCYRNGVFIGCTPDILYARDESGDGRADLVEPVFTGFAAEYAPFETNRLNVQALLNSFHWGVDNRIHGATSMSGGRVERVNSEFIRAWRDEARISTAEPSSKAAPIDLRGRDFSFDPRTLELRPETGGGQHGMSFDNEGWKFVCSNSDHLQWIRFGIWKAIPSPYVPWPVARLSIADDGPAAPVFRISPEEPWRVLRTHWRVTGLVSGLVEGGGRSSGYFTGATGVTVYRGDALSSDHVGDVWIADCGSNLVHRKRITRAQNGLDRVGSRVGSIKGPEFLASTDIWFRPVQLANAPDGGLWIVDMYREVIEHPWSLPPGIKEHLDLNSGNDRGRLWRVVPAEWQAPSPGSFRLQDREPLDWVGLLAHPNGWHRDTAARLLIEQRSVSDAVVVALKQVAHTHSSAVARWTALHVLESLGELSSEDLADALKDADPRVRRHVFEILTWRPAHAIGSENPTTEPGNGLLRSSWRASLQAWQQKEDSPDVLWAAVSLFARMPETERVAWLLPVIQSGNRPLQQAALAASGEALGDLWQAKRQAKWEAQAVQKDQPDQQADDLDRLWVRGLGTRGAVADWRLLQTSMQTMASLKDSLTLANAFLEGYGNRQLPTLPADLSAEFAGWTERAQAELKSILSESKGSSSTLEALLESVQWLDTNRQLTLSWDQWFTLLQQDSHGTESARLSDAFYRWWVSVPAESWRFLPRGLHPELLRRLLRMLVQRESGIRWILDHLEAGMLLPMDLETSWVADMRRHPNAEIRERSRQFLGNPVSDRQEVLRTYLPALSLAGDPLRGQARFAERCQVCHETAGDNPRLGPDLASVAANGPATLLVAILDPNRDVAPNYRETLVETEDGELLSGLLLESDESRLHLALAGGELRLIPRNSIRDLRTTGRSLMPEGLEDGWENQDIADLLAYLSRPE